MPGLVGFLSVDDPDTSLETLLDMQNLITHHAFYQRDGLWMNGPVRATRSHTKVSQPEPQPHDINGLLVWLDGEFYNRSDLQRSLRTEAGSDPEILAELFHHNRDDEAFHFLRQVNGVYSAIVYDTHRQLLHLLTDSYGLRHLYWTVHDGQLAWASEYKAFLALPGFRPCIDSQTVRDFFAAGYCLGDRTWFEGVQVLSSGSVLTWDLAQGQPRLRRYWGWDQIHPMTGPIDQAEITEELGRLFSQAVDRCCRPGERVGVSLSGGLDSRALLAAIPERIEPIHAFTFGRPGCDDIRFASRAAQVRGAVHHVIEMNAGNWLANRFDAVWWLDGQKNLLHMHALHALRHSPQYCDINLNGFLGGNTVGGAYLNQTAENEFDVIDSRGRRFIWGGLRLGQVYHEERPVFFDNEFIAFAMNIPKHIRRRSAIFNKMLLAAWPDYFQHIPWQTTGCPISWPAALVRPIARVRRFRYKLSRRLVRFDISLPDSSQFADYDYWIREEPARSVFYELLFDRQALYAGYINRDRVEDLWHQHLAGVDHANQLCLVVTFEVWLRQVFRHEFLPTKSDNGGQIAVTSRPRTSNNSISLKTLQQDRI